MKTCKKFSSHFLILLFLFSQIGIFKHSHFCGDELASESFFISHEDCGCEPEEDNGCCKNKILTLQFSKESTFDEIPGTVKPLEKVNFIIPNLKCELGLKSFSSPTEFKANDFSPYLSEPPDILLKKMCFLI